MVKGYLKYIFLKQFGLLSNPNCCPVFDLSGKTIFTGSNEFVYQWNKCTSENLLSLAFPSSESNVDSHTVTCISIHPFECSTLAVGYQNGSIRLWNTETREILMTFDGHKSRITVLQFSLDGHLLFSGATDTDIVCWDVTSRSGLFRLRGHTNQVTALRLLHKTIGVEEKDVDMSKDHRDETSPRIEEKVKRRTKKNSMKEQLSECETPSSSKQDANFKYFTCNPLFLLSTSKDGTMKLWDLATHWCIQTVFDSSGEIWSLAVNSLETRVLIGTASNVIRVFSLDENTKQSNDIETSDVLPALREIGTIQRPTSGARLSQLRYITNASSLIEEYNKHNVVFPLVSSHLPLTSCINKNLTCYGTLLTGNNTHTACLNQPQLILGLSPKKKMLEVYREFTFPEAVRRHHKRIRRLHAKVQKKKNEIERLTKICHDFELELGMGKRTQIGTTFDVEREATLQKLQNLTEALQFLEKEAISDGDNVADAFVFLHTFHLKSKVYAMDYYPLDNSILFNFSNGLVSTFILPVKQLLSLKSKLNKSQLVQKGLYNVNPEDIVFKDASQNLQNGHPSCLQSVFVSQDDSMIATLAENKLFIWNFDSTHRIHVAEFEDRLLCGFFVVGNVHIICGTATGDILLYDISTTCIVDKCVTAHKGSIYSITDHPNKTGFVTCGNDKKMKIFFFRVKENISTVHGRKEILSFEEATITDLPDVGRHAKFTMDGKYLAVSLLNFTIQIFYADTLKVFLTLYGHKLPCDTIDVSSDSTLLVSGSYDKTIKLWGLDFGNIQRSWHAHENDITQVHFIKDTHYIVSSGKDGHLKIWDGDLGQLICQLLHHSKPIVSIALSSYDADRIIAGMMDGSLRIWTRSEEQIFASEEQEKILETELDKELERTDKAETNNSIDVFKRPTRRTVASIKTTEQLLEALEICDQAISNQKNYEEALKTWENNTDNRLNVHYKPIQCEPMSELMGLSPYHYLYRVLSEIPSSLQYEVVVALPFVFVEKLLFYVGDILEETTHIQNELKGKNFGVTYTIETLANMALLLAHLHARQFITSPNSRTCLLKIFRYLRPLLLNQQECFHQNKSALNLLQDVQEQSKVIF